MAQPIQTLSSPALVGHCLSSSAGRSKRAQRCGLVLSGARRAPPVSQLDNEAAKVAQSSDRSRREFFISTSLAAAAAALFVMRPEPAHAGKRGPPPPTKEKTEEDGKDLSGLDAKLLASQRRKDGMREMLEKQKKKAKGAVQTIEENVPDVFDQGSEGVEG